MHSISHRENKFLESFSDWGPQKTGCNLDIKHSMVCIIYATILCYAQVHIFPMASRPLEWVPAQDPIIIHAKKERILPSPLYVFFPIIFEIPRPIQRIFHTAPNLAPKSWVIKFNPPPSPIWIPLKKFQVNYIRSWISRNSDLRFSHHTEWTYFDTTGLMKKMFNRDPVLHFHQLFPF